jgi:ABC-type multidrug transport system fused ATPase/permease subunit
MNSWIYRANFFGLKPSSITIMIILSIVATIAEVFGVSIFLPIFQFIRFEGDLDAMIADSSIWGYIIKWFSYFDVSPSLVTLLILSFSLFTTRQILNYIKASYMIHIRQNLTRNQRNLVFNKHIKASADYYDNNPVGVLVNIIMTEINSAMAGLISPINLIVSISILFFYFVLLLILSWEMTLVAIVILIIMIQIPNIWIKQSKKAGYNLVQKCLNF